MVTAMAVVLRGWFGGYTHDGMMCWWCWLVGGVSSPALFATPSGAEPPFACGVIAQCSGRAIGRMRLQRRASSAAFGMAIEPFYTGAMRKTPVFLHRYRGNV